ncbi:BolA family transcriptional regulator [Candidatus Pelagibacter bacterium]|nr:BolA family transcriptional regulator [Candidatus Pelagibacter bacterium]
MDINELIAIVKKKLTDQIDIERIKIEDKSFLHKNHAGNQEGRYHLKIIMTSSELKALSRIESNKRVYKILDKEIKEHIHSIQILIS